MRDFAERRRGDGRAAAAPARDLRRAGPGGDGRGAARGVRLRAPPLRAYADSAQPIGEGQTISQPWIVAAICQALELKGSERLLEVGTGSGYSAAVLAELAAEVISVSATPRWLPRHA